MNSAQSSAWPRQLILAVDEANSELEASNIGIPRRRILFIGLPVVSASGLLGVATAAAAPELAPGLTMVHSDVNNLGLQAINAYRCVDLGRA